MNSREIITKIDKFVNYGDPEEFWEVIKKQNKEKKWSITPVEINITGDKVVENSEQVKRLVKMLQEWADNELQTKDVGILEKDTKIVRVIFEWFSGSRKNITKKFDEIKKNFTGIEADIKNIGLAFKTKKEELLEKEYQKNEDILRGYLKSEIERIKKEYDIELNINVCDDFIATKRKNKILTEKGSLTKKIKDEITAKVKQILEPILKEREVQRLKEQDITKLSIDLKEINVHSLFLEELEQAKGRLQFFLEVTDTAYPNATQEARMQLEALLKIAEANIARLKAEAQKRELEKAEAERKAIELKKQKEIKARAEAIQKAQMQQKEEVQEVREEVQEVKKAKYKIPLEEIEVLTAIEFEAESENEAKEKILKMFKEQLELIELIKI